MTAIQIYKHAFINVAVATFWRSPGSVREIDKPALSNPVQLEKWLSDMTHEDKLDLVGRIDTQALYGEKVLVKRRVQDWAQVEALGQPGKNGAKAYPGWVPIAQLTADSVMDASSSAQNIVFVKPKAFIYTDEECTQEFLEVSFNTQLPLKEESKIAYSVNTPDGQKWVRKVDVELLNDNLPKGEKLIEVGLQFFGLEYLWGGMSAWGFDCSGFAYSSHKRFGISIPRDADDQCYSS